MTDDGIRAGKAFAEIRKRDSPRKWAELQGRFRQFGEAMALVKRNLDIAVPDFSETVALLRKKFRNWTRHCVMDRFPLNFAKNLLLFSKKESTNSSWI